MTRAAFAVGALPAHYRSHAVGNVFFRFQVIEAEGNDATRIGQEGLPVFLIEFFHLADVLNHWQELDPVSGHVSSRLFDQLERAECIEFIKDEKRLCAFMFQGGIHLGIECDAHDQPQPPIHAGDARGWHADIDARFSLHRLGKGKPAILQMTLHARIGHPSQLPRQGGEEAAALIFPGIFEKGMGIFR